MTQQAHREAVVVRMLDAAPDGLDTADVACELGLHISPTKTVLAKARNAGLVQLVQHGTTYRWIAPEKAAALLERLQAGQAPENVDASALVTGFLRGTRRIVAAGTAPPPATRGTRSVWELGARR